MADQLLFAVQSEPSGRGAAGDDERPRIQPFIVDFDPDVARGPSKSVTSEYENRAPNFSACPCMFRISSGPSMPSGKAGKIFDQRRCGQLTARLAAFEHEWAQVRAGGVNRRRQSRATAADDNHFLHR